MGGFGGLEMFSNQGRVGVLPIVSIVVPFFGLTNYVLRILEGNPQKELQWRL